MPWETPQAVESWLGQEREGLTALARSLIRDQADAEDCVQDAYVAALNDPPTSNPGAWLRTVVRRGAYRQNRAASRRWRREVRAARPEGVPSTSQTADHIEIRQRVLAAVKALEEPYRTTVVLRYFEGYSPARIAASQGIPVKTVKTRLSRALAQLRLNLDRAYGGQRSAWAPLVGAIAGHFGLRLLLEKVAAVGAILLVSGGVTWWAMSPGSSESVHAAAVEPSASSEAPVLAGTGHARAPAVVATPGVLREGDPVPAATFAGRVVDPAGLGVANAHVGIIWRGVTPSSPESASGSHLVLRREAERRENPSSVTDAEGYFRKDRPYGSTSYLRVDAQGFAHQLSGPHPSGSFVLVRLATSAGARVRILSDTGSPVVGAEVRMAAPLSEEARQVFAAVRSDATGRAVLPSFTGTLSVQVVPVEPELGTVECGFEPSEEEVVIRVPTVKVREWLILDADTGDPVTGAWVDVVRSIDRTYDQEPQRRRILADRSGVVRVPEQPGYYGRYASAPGYEVTEERSGPLYDRILLFRAMKVEGVVIDEAGAPVEGAAIVVVVPDTGRSGAFEDARWGRSPVTAWSDVAGWFSLELALPYARTNLLSGGVPPDRGVRTVMALHPAHAAAVVDGVRITPGQREEVTLRFPRPGSLAIEVVDKEGSPIVGQGVSVARLIPRASTWWVPPRPLGTDTVALVRGRSLATDAAGYVLADGLPPGPHLVCAENTRVEAEVREGETTIVRMVKGSGPGIRGRVVDSKGAPQLDVQVSLVGPASADSRTGPDGQFAFDDLPEGKYSIRVMLGDGTTAMAASARPGEDVDVRLPSGPARLRIRVNGPPAGTARYALLIETGGLDPSWSYSPLTTDPFETPPFIPGEGVLVVNAPGFGWTAVRFEAAEDRTTDVDVSLPRSGDVVVRVSAAARALEAADCGACVRLQRADWLRDSVAGVIQRKYGRLDAFTRASEDGTFRFPNVVPGPYEASFGHYEYSGSAPSIVTTWVPRSSTRIEVRSGETTSVDL